MTALAVPTDSSLKARAKNTLRRWLLRLLMGLSPSGEFGRVRVHDISPIGQKDGRLGKVMLALQRVHSVCPGLMMRVQNNLERIVVVSDLGTLAGAYDYMHDVCMLAARSVDQSSVDLLSTLIVHEATHAVLRNRGFVCAEEPETWAEERLAWGEDLCCRVERRFFQKATCKEGPYFKRPV